MNNLKKWLLEIRSGMRKGNESIDIKLAVEIIDHIYDIADQEIKNLMIEYIERKLNELV